jgi:hypothetical protein
MSSNPGSNLVGKSVSNPSGSSVVIPFSWLQQTVVNSVGDGTITSANISLSNVQAGSSCVLQFAEGTATSLGTFTVTDNVGSTWTRLVPGAQPGGYYTRGFFVCQALAGTPPANIPTLTVNLSCTTPFDSGGGCGIWLGRASRYITGLDQNPLLSGSTVNMTSPTFATLSQGSGELVMGHGGNGVPAAPSASPGAPWNNIQGASVFSIFAEPIAWTIATSTTPPTPAIWTMPTTSPWVTVGAGFVLSNSGPSA